MTNVVLMILFSSTHRKHAGVCAEPKKKEGIIRSNMCIIRVNMCWPIHALKRKISSEHLSSSTFLSRNLCFASDRGVLIPFRGERCSDLSWKTFGFSWTIAGFCTKTPTPGPKPRGEKIEGCMYEPLTIKNRLINECFDHVLHILRIRNFPIFQCFNN